MAINTLLAFAVATGLWYAGVLDDHTGPLVLATIAAGFAILQRNFFRMVLAAYRRPHDVLLTDICFVVLLLVGTLLAINLTLPATATMIVTGIAAGISGWLAARALWQQQPWNIQGMPGILRSIAPLAALSTAGAAIHWTFSQGYMYLAAGMLDVAAVAALAATRLLMMPVNLLSTGIGTLMLPLTAGWLQEQGSAFALRRLCWIACGIAGLAFGYFAVLWFTRDWIFAAVLKKQFAHSDQLLALWSVAFLVMVMRDQLIYLLVALERFRQLTSLALTSAVLSLFAGYVGMTQLGVVGAPLGVLVGELISVTGIVILSLRFVAPSNRSTVVSEVL
jgi:O-antigen/teichoic acid export membrane protein